MKKKSVNRLNFNKISIASLKETNIIKGGGTSHYCISERDSCLSPCGPPYGTMGCDSNTTESWWEME